jgi:protein TonB
MTFTFSFEKAEPLPMASQGLPFSPQKSTQIAAAKLPMKPALTKTAPIKEEPKPQPEAEGIEEQPSFASESNIVIQPAETAANQDSGVKGKAAFFASHSANSKDSSPTAYPTTPPGRSDTVSMPFINASRQSHIGPPLEYPALALRRGYEGAVLIKIDVDRQGKVTHVQLLESSGYDILDEAVLKTAKKWFYKPAQKGDKPTEDSAKVRIRFRINEAIDIN